MKIGLLLISSVLLISLTRCGKHQYRYKWEKPSFQPLKALSQSNSGTISGRWTDSRTLFYYSRMLINEDRTFSYHYGGCTGRCYTAGSWTMIGNTLVLTSYDKYKKQVEPEEPVMELVDSAKFYLDHVIYRLVGDTLYELDKATMGCNKSKYWRPGDYLPLKTYNEFLYPEQK